MADPYTQVYDAIWALLEANSDFTSLVKSGNRIKFAGGSRSPMKEEVMDADLPEVRVISTADLPHPLRTSSHSSVLKTYEIQIATGDQRLDERLYPLEWAINCAMVNWPVVLEGLTWNGRSFAKVFRFTEGITGVSEEDINRGIEGWSTVWTCTVEMWFVSSELLAGSIPFPYAAYFTPGTSPANHIVTIYWRGGAVARSVSQGGSIVYNTNNFQLRYQYENWGSAVIVHSDPSQQAGFRIEFASFAGTSTEDQSNIWYTQYLPDYLVEDGGSRLIAEFKLPVVFGILE